MTHIVSRSMAEVPYFSSRSSVTFQGHIAKKKQQKNNNLSPISAFPDNKSSLEFTDDHEMTHKTLRGIGKVHYYFSRSSIPFQGRIGQTNSLSWSQLSNPSDLPCLLWHGQRWHEIIICTGLTLGLCPANERRRYFVTTPLIGLVQT